MALRSTCTLLLALLLAPAALAQAAGEVLWKTDLYPTPGYVRLGQPAVGPDGTVYVVSDRLYAIAPDGEILWTAAANQSYVDVAPDGTVYAATQYTVFAYNPDGSVWWSFTEPQPRGWGITTGPTIGPDGNVYAVTIQGGLGAFSLTPEGAFRWNVPGFLTDSGRDLGRIAFGPDNLYHAEDGLWLVEGCNTGPYEGLVSITLDGEVDWCISISGIGTHPGGPRATLDGRAIVRQNALPGIQLQAYNPDGSRDWTRGFFPGSIDVGPDNNLYAFLGATLISMTADGEDRWSRVQPISHFPNTPAISPDVSAVVSGSPYAFGNNGNIIAASAADGHTLWSVPATGPSAGVDAPAAFSPDGSVVYVPVTTLAGDVPDQLWAIQVRDAAQAPVAVSAQPVGGPVTIGPGGGSFSFRVTLTNMTAQPQSFQAWTAVTGPVGREPVVGPQTVTLPPGATVTKTLTQRVPPNAPPGTYTYHVRLGSYPSGITASDSFPFMKQGAESAARGAGEEAGWETSGWAEAPSASALVGGFALSEAHPNPSRGQASLTLAVAAAQTVRAEVYDALGRRVAVLLDGVAEAGAHVLVLDGSALPPGLYVVRVTGETFAATRRVTLLR